MVHCKDKSSDVQVHAPPIMQPFPQPFADRTNNPACRSLSTRFFLDGVGLVVWASVIVQHSHCLYQADVAKDLGNSVKSILGTVPLLPTMHPVTRVTEVAPGSRVLRVVSRNKRCARKLSSLTVLARELVERNQLDQILFLERSSLCNYAYVRLLFLMARCTFEQANTNNDDNNSCLEVYYQFGGNVLREIVLTDLLQVSDKALLLIGGPVHSAVRCSALTETAKSTHSPTIKLDVEGRATLWCDELW